MHRAKLLTCCGLCLCPAALGAAPAIPTVILSNIQSSATSQVPGHPGRNFVSNSRAFSPAAISPDGNHWILGAMLQGTAGEVPAIVVGSGMSASLTAAISGETPVPGMPGDVFEEVGVRRYGINDSGQFALSAKVREFPLPMSVTLRGTPTGKLEPMAITGVQAPGQPPGVGYALRQDSAHILHDGRVRHLSHLLTGPVSGQAAFENLSLAAGTTLLQSGVTVPSGQIVSPINRPVQFIETASVQSDADGSGHVYIAALGTPGQPEGVVVANGQVVLTGGRPVPGWSNSAPLLDPITWVMPDNRLSARNGHRMLFGGVLDGAGGPASWTDFVRVNGQVIAATNQPITPGNLIRWDDSLSDETFFGGSVNSHGEFVVEGWTNASGPVLSRWAMVLNGSTLLVRPGDPVDVNGNGIFDDNAFVDLAGASTFTDDRRLYFGATLRNNAGQFIGSALLVMQVPEPSAGVVVLCIAALRRVRGQRGG